MSELTKGLRAAAELPESFHLREDLLEHLDDYERLEADLEINTMKIRQLQAEHARVCNEHALLVQESGREGRELDRLEGLVRGWATLEEEWKWNNETHRGTALIKAKDALYAEGLRIAKEKP